jgi:hypothetical protein
MKILRTFPLIVMLLWVSSLTTAAQDGDTTIINKFIASQAAKIGGDEYPDARKIVKGDLNHDGVPDLAVLYTIEGMGGGNNHVQYLAVFVRSQGRLLHLAHTAVGGKLNRAVELKSISKNIIYCEILLYRPKDPSCCPSMKGTARYVLTSNKLTQM